MQGKARKGDTRRGKAEAKHGKATNSYSGNDYDEKKSGTDDAVTVEITTSGGNDDDGADDDIILMAMLSTGDMLVVLVT